MKYNLISYDQAKALYDFWPDGLMDEKDAPEYRYYVAYEEDTKKIAASAAVDPLTEGARLITIGVSPECHRQGVGSALIDLVISDLIELADKTGSTPPPVLKFEWSMRKEDWEAADGFYTSNGFTRTAQNDLSSITLAKILENETLKKGAGHMDNEHIKPMRDVPAGMIREFGNEIMKKGLFPGLPINDYDRDLSIMYVDGTKVLGCILMSHLEDGSIMNDWIYLDPKVKDRAALIRMFGLCASRADKRVSAETKVFFLPVAEEGDKLLKKLLPGTKEEFQFRVYERPLEKAAYDDPVFEEVSEKLMVCIDCIHSTGCAGECAKYIQKPGDVMYGLDCDLYEKH